MPQPSFTSCSLVVSVGSGPGSVIVLKAPADRLGARLGCCCLVLPRLLPHCSGAGALGRRCSMPCWLVSALKHKLT